MAHGERQGLDAIAGAGSVGATPRSARAVLDGKLWVFGGFIGTSTNALNDVWYSDDGITWTQQALHAPWGPRLPVAIVFQDKIWIYSGKHTGGTDNWGGDLWQMTTAAEA